MLSDAAADAELDLGRLLLLGSGLYTLLNATLHPLNVLKTRAQVASSRAAAYPSQLDFFRSLLGPQYGGGGVRGLFAGLVPVLVGAIPARAAYITALEVC